jgi:hypothetical protein
MDPLHALAAYGFASAVVAFVLVCAFDFDNW